MIGRMSHWNYLFDEETMQKQLDIARSRREFENGKISVAIKLLSLGTMSQEDIAKVTDLTIEKIKELASQTASTAHV